MLLKVAAVAALAVLSTPYVAGAQSLAQIGGPAELPPAGFKGQQFVDSRGCVFLRAGYAGKPNWVPRVTKDRKVLCGLPPTFGPQPVIEMADESAAPATSPAMVAEVDPQKAAASVMTDQTASAAMPMPADMPMPAAAKPAAAVPVVVPGAGAKLAAQNPAMPAAPSFQVVSQPVGAVQPGCFKSAPVSQVVQLRDGGTAVVCTRGDGTTTGWRAPVYPAGTAPGASLRSAGSAPDGVLRLDIVADPSLVTPVIPEGYKVAWKDGRLNPNRAIGTAAGQAAQDQIWTKTVPARLVSDRKAAKRPVQVQVVSVSTKSMATVAVPPPDAPVQVAAPAARGGAWVQVGTFGVPANAEGAAQRLADLGLPVATNRLTKGGKALQMVLAGPFATADAAQAALQAARGAGFGDAFLR